MERGPTDLDQVLASAIRMVQHEIAPRATLVRETEAMPLVVGGQRKLEQVFVNLLMNAIQALPEGRMGRVTVRTAVDPEGATVSVSDDGVGIARAHLDRVFDPFFTTKPVGVGTGLGLSICHGIVTAVGGSITIDSEEGRGTTVHVRLPRSIPPERVEARPVAPSPAPKSARHHVLVIEDQLPLARTLARALAQRFQVTLAATVAEGLAAIEQHHTTLDVILCDMLMPDGTGIDVFEGTRSRYPELAGRFVFMTGGAFLPSLAEFLERSPNPRIDKPFGLPALEELLEQVVEPSPR
jgi:CheY-like chemotaxis protein